MGLRYPEDLDAWRRWQHAQRPVRRAVHAVRTARGAAGGETRLTLHERGDRHDVLVAVDATTPSKVAALVRPAGDLPTSYAVLAPGDITAVLPGDRWRCRPVGPQDIPRARVTLAAGHFLPVGACAHAAAIRQGSIFCVVQHGLLTPFAPPLPPRAHLLAWSDEDASYWAAGRGDITTTVVGSQLLWEAAEQGRSTEAGSARPTYLGQLHGAELPRSGMARSAGHFCRETGAAYRPHPAETDKLSRLQHAVWERRGMVIDRSAQPLHERGGPVVSAFSTGVLEAAARGIPAWVYYERPPSWLREFWRRYGMSPWGGPSTARPVRARTEPAAQIARHVTGLLDDG